MDTSSMRLPAISSFLTFLLALIGLLLVHPLVQHYEVDGRFFEAAFSITMVGGAFGVAKERRRRITALLLVALAVAFRWGGMTEDQAGPLAALAHLFALAFFIYTAALLLQAVLNAEEVTTDTLYGSVAVYLMLALCWAFLYELIELFQPGSFSSGGRPAFLHSEGGFGEFIYFSIATITTLGYGDIVPAAGFARMVTVLEAVVGQIYVAVLVGKLVGMHLQNRGVRREG